jgi:hypothetical protein
MPHTGEEAHTHIPTGVSHNLVLDGQRCDVDIGFLLYGVDHNIIVRCLPSHSSHLLKPLHVALCGTMHLYHKSELDKLNRDGLTSIKI